MKQILKGLRFLSLYYYIGAAFCFIYSFFFSPNIIFGSIGGSFLFYHFTIIGGSLFGYAVLQSLMELLITFFTTFLSSTTINALELNLNPFIIFRIGFIALAILSYFIGRGFYKSQPWARTAAIILSILGIITIFYPSIPSEMNLSIALRLLVNGVIIYYLFFKLKPNSSAT
ncbi:hypothetical protein J4208_02525 [Candidatus Woesearchaeota archaeon]|nr:hypothetical protein [Candidatus Woesearchaeota archaeon]